MGDDLKVIVQAILEANVKASAEKIASQIPEIEKIVNLKSKIQIPMELPTKKGNKSFFEEFNTELIRKQYELVYGIDCELMNRILSEVSTD